MLKPLAQRLTRPSAQLKDETERRRARLLATLVLPLLPLSLAGSFLSAYPAEQLVTRILFFILIGCYLTSRTRFYLFGGVIASLSLIIPPYVTLLMVPDYSQFAVITWASWMSIGILLGTMWLPAKYVVFLWLSNFTVFVSTPLWVDGLSYSVIPIPAMQIFVFGLLILLGGFLRDHDLKQITVASEQLQQANQKIDNALQAKSIFLANMSHEIRTPMNGILGMLELIEQSPLNKVQRERIRIAHSSAETLLNILNDVLDHSKIEAGRLDLELLEVDIGRLVEETCFLFNDEAYKKNVELLCFLGPEVASRVQCDPTRMRQILTNLISNAIKFTNQGEISVSLHAKNATEDTQTLLLEIKDTGIGIAADKQQQIFESFTQADGSITRHYGGTGLGLTITHQLVELMGGKMGVESVESLGTRFWVELTCPIIALQTDQAIANLPSKVLVVDDNDANRTILSAYLSSWGIENLSLSDPKKVLRTLITHHQQGNPFDLLLTDMMMPDMDGVSLKRVISEHPEFTKLPVVLLSSAATLDERTHKADFAAIMSKPVRRMSLFDILSSIGVQEKMANTPKESPFRKLHGHVLLVEDNLVNQMVECKFLDNLGLSYELANDGQQAVELFQRKRYDLILMDCQMPIMDGYEATRQIRSLEGSLDAESRIPIVAITANTLEREKLQCFSAGMDDHLSKPMVMKELHEKLAYWLENSSRHQLSNSHK